MVGNIRYISANYIFADNSFLKNGIVAVSSTGQIIDIIDTGGYVDDRRRVEFYNGIIVPGFVNCHCHLELSGERGVVPKHTGLPSFIQYMRTAGTDAKDDALMAWADNDMFLNGIVACVDICDSADSFEIKKRSKIHYHNMVEVFGSDPAVAANRLSEAEKVVETAKKMAMPYSVVPHAPYSMSVSLLKALKERFSDNKISSMHFMETESESSYMSDLSGALADSFRDEENLVINRTEVPLSSLDAVKLSIDERCNLISVHNTFIDKKVVDAMMSAYNVYWCLCPKSNLYIENMLPPIELLRSSNATIVIGTDSLASNDRLSVFDELKTIQNAFPELSLTELLKWGSYNGAKALELENIYGKIGVGFVPGILLIEKADLINLKLLPESTIKRLV